MRGSLEKPPIVLGRSKRDALIGTLVLLALPIFPFLREMRVTPESETAAKFMIVLSVAGLLLMACQLRWTRLEIGPEGISQRVLLKTWKFLWSDISNFQAYVPGSYQMVVGFDYFPPPERRLSLKSYNRTLAAGRGSLWPGWEVEPEPLADMLNRARSKWWTA